MTIGHQFVTLGVGDEIFAAPVDDVREVLDCCDITHVPNAPPFLRGIIDVRGKSAPVIDLRVKFGLPPAEVTGQTRIVVLDMIRDGRSLLIGVLTDQVYEVTSLEEREIDPPPEIGIRWRSEFIRGIGRRNGRFVIILDLAAVMASDVPIAQEEVAA